MRKTVLSIFVAAFSLASLTAEDAFPLLRPFKTYVVENPSLTGMPDAKSSGASGEKWNPRERRHGGGAPGDNYYPADLVWAPPGSLEPPGSKFSFYFAFEDQLGLKYESGSFAFSGRADSLFWQPQTGWGSEDINQDMLPLLLRSDREDVNEPSYEFIWQHPTDKPFAGDSIYLNYMFKVPKQSRTLGMAQLRTRRQSFDRGFSTDAPPVVGKSIAAWRGGSIAIYDASLSSPSFPQAWSRLPSGIKATGFSATPGLSIAVFAEAELKVSARQPDGSSVKWTCPGAAPAIVCGDFCYSATADYSAIQAIRLSDGKAQPLCPLPKFLPRSPNSFATARLSSKTFLIFLVPAQSKTIFFEIQ